MHLPHRLERVLDQALGGQGPGREDCVYLLSLPSESLEAGAAMAVADATSRRRFGNEAILLGQIGVETVPCPGNCRFCAFGEEHTEFEPARLPLEEILRRGDGIALPLDLGAGKPPPAA